MPSPLDRKIQLPPGLYDRLITESVQSALQQLQGETSQVVDLLPAERAPQLLARHLAAVAQRLLAALLRSAPEGDLTQLSAAGAAALKALDARVSPADQRPEDRPAQPLRLLREVVRTGQEPRAQPLIPLSESALLVNEPGEPGLSAQLVQELASADRVDLLCAFINWHGVRLLEAGLRDLLSRGGRLRILTSMYMGTTQSRAASPTDQRNIHHREQRSAVLLFCRGARQVDGRATRYVCLGLGRYVRHQGAQPWQIVSRLRCPLLSGVCERFRAAVV